MAIEDKFGTHNISIEGLANGITNDEKRQEFLRDFERLKGRCGYNAMLSTVQLYIIEKLIEEGKKPIPGTNGNPKLQNAGYKNTSEIIARFVEKGWMDFYLANFDIFTEWPLFQIWGDNLLISQRDGNRLEPRPDIIIMEKPVKELKERVEKELQSIIEGATYIPPDRIRAVFAEIDLKYTSH